jgi:hypothetical protein
MCVLSARNKLVTELYYHDRLLIDNVCLHNIFYLNQSHQEGVGPTLNYPLI